MEAAVTDHNESVDHVAQTDETDKRQRAEDKILDTAVLAKEDLEEEARRAAGNLTNEVVVLRKEIKTLQDIDNFKGRVYVVAILAAVFEVAAFVGLWMVSQDMNRDTGAIRTDLEVHRIRNEASHDCLAEKMTKLPSPEARAAGTDALTREFVHEFLGCVADVAPTIVPPGAPDLRVTTRKERGS